MSKYLVDCTAQAATTVKLSTEVKQRMQQLLKCVQFAIHCIFIQPMIYLGIKRGADPRMPKSTILSLL
ncbi:mitochondrial import receptor subunit TOM7 homolog [Pipistrellus kuhlii]|uniref:mitochondrial import receptor subunit TOM7 homolog n=1 Tax=Pipistrellus kuhlii TaxID=59472 RepID=UPI00174ECEDF|nr:mitochondrial import receptor subunit TOM7 homolog [Pipistrellus kuhlii]